LNQINKIIIGENIMKESNNDRWHSREDKGVNYIRNKGVVRPSECYVNHSYARDLKPNQIKYLMKNWDSQRVELPLVCEVSEDKYEIINGQHRFHVIEKLFGSEELVEVQVLPYMPVKERSDLYDRYNKGSKPLTFDERFKARIISEDTIAVSIAKICNDSGVKMSGITAPKGSSARNYPVSRSIKLMEDLFKRGVLERTLAILTTAYGDTDKDFSRDALSNNLLRSIGRIVYHFRHEINEERLIEVLRSKPAWTWTTLTTVAGISGSLKESYGAITIMENYNKNLTINRLDASRLTAVERPSLHKVHKDYMQGVEKG